MSSRGHGRGRCATCSRHTVVDVGVCGTCCADFQDAPGRARVAARQLANAPVPEGAYRVGMTGTYRHGMLGVDVPCEVVRVSKRAIEITCEIDGRAEHRSFTRASARGSLRVG